MPAANEPVHESDSDRWAISATTHEPDAIARARISQRPYEPGGWTADGAVNMRKRSILVPTIIAGVAVLAVSSSATAQHTHGTRATASQEGLQIPEPMRLEHEEIHAHLEAATKAPGAVGAAARELAAVLAPHFERENQIALPPLGLLAPLAHGESIPDGVRARALAMTDSLRAELPGMLEEHVRIAAAAKKLEQVARAHGDADVEALARKLQVHARMEEEVNYPAAVLVGMLLRRG
jgi:hypothetical protein